MSAARRVARAAETIRARWERDVASDPQTEAAQALEDTGQLLDPEVAAELERLRAEREKYVLVPKWEYELVERLPARVAELEARPSPADVLRQAADDLTAACPDHGDADEAWMDCPCEFADELRRKADLAGLYAAEAGCMCPPAGRPHQVGCPLDGVPGPGERTVDRLTRTFAPVASLREDGYESPLRHAYRVGHDLPETGGDQ